MGAAAVIKMAKIRRIKVVETYNFYNRVFLRPYMGTFSAVKRRRIITVQSILSRVIIRDSWWQVCGGSCRFLQFCQYLPRFSLAAAGPGGAV